MVCHGRTDIRPCLSFISITNMWTTVLVLTICLILHMSYGAPPAEEIKYMPGLHKQPYWKQYSGYLNATGTKQLHYWFVQSANKPSEDPLVLWMNGGPGCSSDLGLLSEHGPFRIGKDGASVSYNPHAWNNVANMMYLEAPAGVGFSYSQDKNYTTDDDQVALDNHMALKNFFLKFPEYAKNDFYITGESYGGIYVPTLSARVVDDTAINFKGFVVGNGLSDDEMNSDSLVYFAYYHGLIGDSLWSGLSKYCCQGNMTRCAFSQSRGKEECGKALSPVTEIVYGSGLNEYNLYGTCEGGNGIYFDEETNKVAFTHQKWQMKNNPYVSQKMKFIQDFTNVEDHLRLTPPCLNYSNVVKYLNTAEVRKQLHIPDMVQKWDICSADINLNYGRKYDSMKDQYNKILLAKKKVMVYNGDVDMACNFLGDEWFVESLNQKLVTERKAWHYTPEGTTSTQVAGFVKQFEDLALVTVRGAGHMVPTDKPQPALIMITNYLQDKPFQ
ncbi:lysosomal protective protein-like isoform X2 [Mytilus edulis]|uniref:lysosomal protective protein-like isoform X2 n=2 Tax=Mytilus edulis TaxID=6550 RepID=UPI0039F04D43